MKLLHDLTRFTTKYCGGPPKSNSSDSSSLSHEPPQQSSSAASNNVHYTLKVLEVENLKQHLASRRDAFTTDQLVAPTAEHPLQLPLNHCSNDCPDCYPSWTFQRTASGKGTFFKGSTRLRRAAFRRAEKGKHSIGPTLAPEGQYLPFLRQRSMLQRRPSAVYAAEDGKLGLRRTHILKTCGHVIKTEYPEPCGANCLCPSKKRDSRVGHARICTTCISEDVADRYATKRHHAERVVGEAMSRNSLIDALLDPDQPKQARRHPPILDFKQRREMEMKVYGMAEPILDQLDTIRDAEVAYDRRQEIRRHVSSTGQQSSKALLAGAARRKAHDQSLSDYRGTSRTRDMSSIKQHVEGELKRSKSYKEAKERASRPHRGRFVSC